MKKKQSPKSAARPNMAPFRLARMLPSQKRLSKGLLSERFGASSGGLGGVDDGTVTLLEGVLARSFAGDFATEEEDADGGCSGTVIEGVSLVLGAEVGASIGRGGAGSRLRAASAASAGGK